MLSERFAIADRGETQKRVVELNVELRRKHSTRLHALIGAVDSRQGELARDEREKNASSKQSTRVDFVDQSWDSDKTGKAEKTRRCSCAIEPQLLSAIRDDDNFNQRQKFLRSASETETKLKTSELNSTTITNDMSC